jgi:hypothetical protein
MPLKALSKRASDAAANPVVEHLLNIIKAALSTAPLTGGIASLMTDYIPSRRQRRLEEFTERLAADLARLQGRIREETVLTDEFAHIFEQCFRGAAENYQAEKLEAFRGILVNAATGCRAAADEQEYFLGLVRTLSALHLRILSFMADPRPYLETRGIPANTIRGGFSQFFPVAIPGVELEVIKSAFGDLYQAGFINTDKAIFATMTSSQGLDLLAGRVSTLGKRFITFCTTPG